jgi:hypothetical protein
MVKLDKKLKATTIIESMIAMIIIVICFGIGTMIFNNILSSDKHRQELKAMLYLNQEAIEIKKEKIFLDNEKQIGEWTIKSKIEKYEQTENLIKLELLAINSKGKIIAKRNELIVIE